MKRIFAGKQEKKPPLFIDFYASALQKPRAQYLNALCRKYSCLAFAFWPFPFFTSVLRCVFCWQWLYFLFFLEATANHSFFWKNILSMRSRYLSHRLITAWLALSGLASASQGGHAHDRRRHHHHHNHNHQHHGSAPARASLAETAGGTGMQLEKRGRGKCEFPTNAGLVAITPHAKNAGWALSPDQPCLPDSYCPYACPPGQLMAQWDPKATTYTYPQSQVRAAKGRRSSYISSELLFLLLMFKLLTSSLFVVTRTVGSTATKTAKSRSLSPANLTALTAPARWGARTRPRAMWPSARPCCPVMRRCLFPPTCPTGPALPCQIPVIGPVPPLSTLLFSLYPHDPLAINCHPIKERRSSANIQACLATTLIRPARRPRMRVYGAQRTILSATGARTWPAPTRTRKARRSSSSAGTPSTLRRRRPSAPKCPIGACASSARATAATACRAPLIRPSTRLTSAPAAAARAAPAAQISAS